MNRSLTQSVADLAGQGVLAVNGGYPAKNEELAPRGLPFARSGDVNNGFHFDSADRFPEADLGRVGLKISEPGDDVFTSKGTVGRFAFVRPDTPRFVYSPQLCFWRVLDQRRIWPRFLYYWMHGRVFFVQYSRVKGQTDMADYVSLADQRRMRITLPPIGEQKAIAQILGVLDDKIDLNRRMNETLEAMARTIFKSWFVDFDPVRAKAAGRRPAGMDAETAKLFPAGFEDSLLGEIPKGWQVGAVGDCFGTLMGQSPPGSTYNENGEGLAFFQGRRDFGFRFPSRRVYCTAPTRLARAGDTLVSVRAPVGDINLAVGECAIGRGVAAIRHRSGAASYTYHAMHFMRDDFARFEAAGTVFGCMNKDDFRRIHHVVAPEPLIRAFEALASPVDQRVFVNERESASLAAVRDALLPKLLSGEILAYNGERFVEAGV